MPITKRQAADVQNTALAQAQGRTTGGITPEGVIEIAENGLFDVTQYAQANVNVENIPKIMEFDFTLNEDAGPTTMPLVTIPCEELVEFLSVLPVSYTPTSLKNTRLLYFDIRRAEDPDELSTPNIWFAMSCAAICYRTYEDRFALGMWKPSSIQLNQFAATRYDAPAGFWFDTPQYNTGIVLKGRSGSTSNQLKAGAYKFTVYNLEAIND